MQLLLVRHSNLGPILYRFGAIAGFCASVPLLFHLIWGVSPLDKIVAVGSMWASILSYSAVKLFSKYSNLCDHFTIHQRHRQRDGQTDDNIMQSNPKTALCTIYRSSRGKKTAFAHRRRDTHQLRKLSELGLCDTLLQTDRWAPAVCCSITRKILRPRL